VIDEVAVVNQRPASMARMILDRVAATPDREAFRYPVGDRWESLDWRRVGDRVRAIAAGLLALGIRPEDPVAIAANRAEFQALISPFGYRRATRIRPDDLRQLSVPTLMIWGDSDPVVPIEAARAAAQLIPDARLEVLPAGHVPWLGHPEQVAELLTAFARG